MIGGVGTDILSVARIDEALQEFGERFAKRILCEDEYVQYVQSSQSAHFLAKRFAIKEAVVKALGTGFRGGVSWQDMCVMHTPLGAPVVRFSGAAAEHVSRRGISAVHVSVADEREHVVAFAVAETALSKNQ